MSMIKCPPVGVVRKLGEEMSAQVSPSSLNHGSKLYEIHRPKSSVQLLLPAVTNHYTRLSAFSFTPNAAVLFVDVAIQPEVRFIAKQNSLMKIGNNGHLVLGPIRRIYALLDDRFDELPNQTENKSLNRC
ncbi:hypothetical protein TNCV_4304131 [Trichonephila clavipes]|uniref:Uncharacterized protein n=1 Tax=Trichonephila clavipes TaxID=2585209 RepID=A0A8X6UZL4_TRICX|nr:hypothetical protein TNCV_4304131 [Trichonephila clavipes]